MRAEAAGRVIRGIISAADPLRTFVQTVSAIPIARDYFEPGASNESKILHDTYSGPCSDQ
jgi:hypothetical protein